MPSSRVRASVFTCLFMLVGVFSSCSRHIYHPQAMKSDEVISVDAKQRFLVTAKQKDELRKVCLEPSPDVFSVLSAAFEGSAKYLDKASVDLKSAFAEAGATIGSRTETVQLLRDSMYRICELALNGDISRDRVGELHEQYQKSMVTLAAVASLADASRPSQIALTGRSTITRGALISELSKQIEDEKKVQAEKAEAATTAAEKAAEKDVGTVCERKVKVASCAESVAKCEDDPAAGQKLCEDLGKGTADTPEKKLARAKEYCSSVRNNAPECTSVSASSAADKALENSTAAVKQLEKELEEAKSNSDLSAVTQVVSLPPTTVQPRRENIEQVSKVVKCLVTQVYTDSHVGYCLRLMDRHKASLDTVASLMTEYYAKADAKKISVTDPDPAFNAGELPKINMQQLLKSNSAAISKDPEIGEVLSRLYASAVAAKSLDDLIKSSCTMVTASLSGPCE